MQQKFFIHHLSSGEIVKLYETIKPIVCHNGELMYLNELSLSNLERTCYLIKNNGFKNKVDISTLGILADVKMLHSYTDATKFRPSVGEILSQIPEELRNVTVAFEIIYSPYGQPDFEIFKDEFNQHYHVSIIRLYQKFEEGCPKAEKLLEYPTPASCLPIYMEVEKFNKLISK